MRTPSKRGKRFGTLTLRKTWSLCLKMWKWISEVYGTEGFEEYDVVALKLVWLNHPENREHRDIFGSCFFCDYARARCINCPGKRVEPEFNCTNYKYNYETNPVEFYKELVRLNKIRKG